ncbi:PLP-dependent transferase [Neurospora crassa]|uniref:Aminotransferase n=1 Tax=Neurospora crassa (strain ATCC 24698 / 74-OR23-1A / CBS 708.71 / DSM 1257 / FGSC 987) TaxID=367110 RepID=A7UWJ7_NEUCR|nr:aminotransferase [Neurospora crassa OR74A]EDO65426.2 aminotransferase [Neurospora crassa OR74A]KHE85396.1 PLP-dependent transferase [Neurospora crassa]|eukprot:XP_001728517.2 aminotransferase [Neurospora crassa OR74A]
MVSPRHLRFTRCQVNNKAMVPKPPPTLSRFHSSHQQLNIPTSSSLQVNINTSTTLTTTTANMSPSTPPALSDPDVPTPLSQPGEKKQINLLRGWPSPHLLPPSHLLSASTSLLTSPPEDEPSSKFSFNIPALQYGADPGYEPLRHSLAAWLTQNYTAHETYPSHGFPTLTTAEQICITGGASQNLANILQGFTDPAYTRAVWAVSPCYFLAVPIFEDAGFAVGNGKLKGVREDEEGVDLEELERGILDVEGEKEWPGKPVYKTPGPHRKCYKHIIYLVATSANPSGITTSLSRRHALVQLARKYDALIISDDVYDFLQWPVLPSSSPSSPSSSKTTISLPTPLPRLSDIDISLGPSLHDLSLSAHYTRSSPSSIPNEDHQVEDMQPLFPTRTIASLHFGHAVSNGSFSKLLSPGLRTGWTHSTPAFAHGLSQTGSTRSGGAPSQFCAALIHELIQSGALDRHLSEVVRPGLQKRHALTMDAIRRELVVPLGVRVIEDNRTGAERKEKEGEVYGGYFLWLELPETGFTAKEVAERALEEERLVVSPGENAEVSGEGIPKENVGIRFPRHLRVCFSWEEEEDLVEGVERLGRVLRKMMEEEAKEGGKVKKVGGEGLKAFK